jgi:hypothetical protein
MGLRLTDVAKNNVIWISLSQFIVVLLIGKPAKPLAGTRGFIWKISTRFLI